MSDALYWYFAPSDRRLRHGDGRAIVLGETHRVDWTPKLCKRGLHASERALDALRLGGGPVVYRVSLSGNVVRGDDKLCATERTYVAGGIDATSTLIEFACCVAEAAMLLAEYTDQRSWDAIEATRAFMRGEIDRTALLQACADAAADAADAAAAAAYAAAYACAAAAYACAAAVYAAAADAAKAEINDLLESMLTEAMA